MKKKKLALVLRMQLGAILLLLMILAFGFYMKTDLYESCLELTLAQNYCQDVKIWSLNYWFLYWSAIVAMLALAGSSVVRIIALDNKGKKYDKDYDGYDPIFD